MPRALIALLVNAFLMLAFLPGAVGGGRGADAFVVVEEHRGADGALEGQHGYMRHDPDLWFVRERTHRPNHQPGGGEGDGGGSDGDPGTDCAADNHQLTGFRWTSPYAATATAFATQFDTAGRTWDAATTATLFIGVTNGSAAPAGRQDFVNQIGFADLGTGGTIAVTTTWYYRSTGIAVESDAEYNTRYAWASDGRSDAMDAEAIGTHELGHTFGLGHPKGSPTKIGCLTMYAYGDDGQTHQRTLGDGDILGIRALYGP